ncbi:PorV/PorQ family protein [candidate division KSB1 bacterium]
MKRITVLLTICLLGFIVTGAQSQAFDNTGTSALNFLKMGIGSRAQAMAGAYTAQANDVYAVYWNVAGINQVEGTQVAFSQNQWIADITHYFIGAVFPAGEYGKIGLEVIYLDTGTMRRTTWEDPTGMLQGRTFDSSDMSMGVAYARDLTDRFRFGVKAKYVREEIAETAANAIALDFGTQYNTGFRGMKIGMAIHNFGSKTKLDGSDLRHKIDPYPNEGSNPDDVWAKLETEGFSLPVSIRIGVSMDLMSTDASRLTLNTDFLDYRDVKELFLIGGEYAMLNEMVFLRAGMTDQYDEDWRFNFGAGLNYDFGDIGVAVDYSYSDLGILDRADRYSIRLSF